MKPSFFETPALFRAWLEKNHATALELWVGYYRKETGLPSIDWSQSVDEALCFGWIDGIRKRVDAKSYTNRFTPRRPGSSWSAINIRKVAELKKAGRMAPAGLAAYGRRKPEKSGVYTYEQRAPTLVEPYASMLRKNKAAWRFFQSTIGSYQKAANWWVVSAKTEETRLTRLGRLIEDSSAGRTLRQFSRYVAPGVREGDADRSLPGKARAGAALKATRRS